MVRPLALIVPLSLLALACTPVADGDPEPSSPGEDEDEVQVAAVAEASHALKTPAGCSARPSEATPIDPQAEPDQGQLKIQRDGAWLGLPLQELRYDTVVVGTLAETTVTQIFYNPLPDRLEAIYTFPLPDDAAVDDYWIRVGQRQIRGALKRREDAEKTYEDARRSGQTAALMTQERPNLFNQAVANIAPGETIEVVFALAVVRSNGVVNERNSGSWSSTEWTPTANLEWAIQSLREIDAKRPNDPTVQADLGEALSKLPRTQDESLKLLGGLAQKDLMGSPFAYAALAKIRETKGDTAGAQAAIKRCEEMSKVPGVCKPATPASTPAAKPVANARA